MLITSTNYATIHKQAWKMGRHGIRGFTKPLTGVNDGPVGGYGELSDEENKGLPSFQIDDLGRRKVS